jgi:hypothetical protein
LHPGSARCETADPPNPKATLASENPCFEDMRGEVALAVQNLNRAYTEFVRAFVFERRGCLSLRIDL